MGRLKHAAETITYPGQANRSQHISNYSYNMQSGLVDANITNVNGSTWSANYSYKKDGNIEQKTINNQPMGYKYDTDDDPETIFDSDIMTKAGDDNLTWNENGQLAQTPTITFNCNWDGKLRSAVIGSDTVDIKYDPMGNRVYKASSVAGNRRYIVDISGSLPVILCEIDDSNGSLKSSYIYANGQTFCWYNSDASVLLKDSSAYSYLILRAIRISVIG